MPCRVAAKLTKRHPIKQAVIYKRLCGTCKVKLGPEHSKTPKITETELDDNE